MTDYAYTGKKGTGKSKHAVLKARDRYLSKGRPVATNLDIDLSAMFGPRSRITYVRVPDKPCEFDLLAVGHGNPDSYDEDKNGALILDELGTWFNARTFNDKGRAGALDYLAHARKHGWDCFYIMQDIAQVDKQLRESFIEQTVRHTRFDKVRVPFIGGFLSLLFGEKVGYLPRFHAAVSRAGTNSQDLVCDRLFFKGKDIEACYDTRQVFQASYPHGTHSVLSPWHREGRFLEAAAPTLAARLLAWWRSGPSRPRPAPLTVPDPAYSRVLSLVRSLPASERLRWLRRWDGLRLGRGVSDRAPHGPAVGRP